ncbi:MAG: hypothetical protein AAFR56_00345, partial [Chloroflexota bacterium]
MLSVVEVIIPWLVVAGLFVVMRRLETWLHQHIFKVGWLVTKDYQTTTILYYTLLLPGVVLNQLVYWLAAGFFNVRAQRQFEWPQAQQIGRLELKFIKLNKNTTPLQVAVISTAPLIAGVVVVWAIANYIFRIPQILEIIAPGTLLDVSAGLQELLAAPDFWLWFYVAFCVANTMIPTLSDLGGVRTIGIGFAVVTGVMVVIGVGDELLVDFLGGPVSTVLNLFATTFAVVLAMDVVVISLLSAIENTIEVITGDSADFKNGRMITMTREERLASRQKEIEKARAAREKRRAQQQATSRERVPVAGGLPSIYRLPLPVPGPPGEVRVTAVQTVLVEKETTPQLKNSSARAGATLIE